MECEEYCAIEQNDDGGWKVGWFDNDSSGPERYIETSGIADLCRLGSALLNASHKRDDIELSCGRRSRIYKLRGNIL